MDRYFGERGMAVPWRQMAAHAEACFDMDEPRVVPDDREPVEGCYRGDDLLIRVERWYTTTYGDALKIRPTLPPSLIFLCGDFWKVEFPFVVGRAMFFAGDPQTGPAVAYTKSGVSVYEHGALVHGPLPDGSLTDIAKLDVLDFLTSFPKSARVLLGAGELPSILLVLCRDRLWAQRFAAGTRYKFIGEAFGDLTASADHVARRPPQAGAAKWAALQGVEKAMKSFLHHAGVAYPTSGRKGHDLALLAGLVTRAGGPAVPARLIADVQCEASVLIDVADTPA